MSVLDVPARRGVQAHQARETTPRRRYPWVRTGLASAGLVLVVAGLLEGNPGLIVTGLMASLAAGPLSRLSLDVAVPLAALALLSAATVAGTIAAVADVNLLDHDGVLAASYVATSVVSTALAARTRRAPSSPRRPVVALAPGVLAALTALWQSVDASVGKTWAFWGTDFAHHMLILRDVQIAGHLDYSESLYPRGLHMLGALASVKDAPVGDRAELLDYDLRLTAFLTWFSVSLLLWTGAAVLTRLAEQLGMSRRLGAVASLCLGTAIMGSNSFHAAFVFMGAAPSLLAVAALWAFPLGWMMRSSRASLVLPTIWAAAFLAVAHTWQALVLVPVIAVSLLALPYLGEALKTVRRMRFSLLAPAAPVLPLLCIAALPVASAAGSGGPSVAGIAGDLTGPPVGFVLLSLASVLAVVPRWRAGWARLVIGAALAHVALVVMLLVNSGQGVDLNQWYPLKAIWFLCLSVAPLAALGACWFTAASWRTLRTMACRTPYSFAIRGGVAATLVAVAVAFWLPGALSSRPFVTEAWRLPAAETASGQAPSTWSAERYDIARHYGREFHQATVVPYQVGWSVLFDTYGTRMVSELLSFQTGQPVIRRDHRDLCRQIEAVAGDGEAVVVSKLSPGRVNSEMARDGCVGRARVVHIPGRLSDVSMLDYASRFTGNAHR